MADIINLAQLKIKKHGQVNIEPAKEEYDRPLAEEHSSDPIKDIETIRMIASFLKGKGRYRDYMLFILGINFGLRISDLLTLRFADLLEDDGTFRTTFPILEKKTSKTRKVAKNRYVTINDAVMDAVILYLNHTPGVSLSDYLFRSQSNNGCNSNHPLDRSSVDRILKKLAKDLHLTEHVATHTLRKTFAYHQMLQSGNDPRMLLLLQKIFGHSTSMQTLTYIGVTNDEIEEAYRRLNLGGKDYTHTEVDSKLLIGVS